MTGLIGFLKMELPTGDVRLCDGGFIEYNGELYVSEHEIFGAISGLQPLNEGVGNEVPALQLTLVPGEDALPGDLTQPGFQRSRVRLWIGEFDTDTGQLIGNPDLMFDGQIDQTVFSVGAGRELSMSIVSTAERLFELNTGNSLSSSFHKSVWPGEKGHDNATGLTIPVAWGTGRPINGSNMPPNIGWRTRPRANAR